MMYSKTYDTVVGLNYIEDAAFAGATLYGVKRNGLGFTRISGTSVPSNMEFNLIGSRIYFDPTNPFIDGEYVWVMMDRASSGAICVPVSIDNAPVYLPDGIFGVAYYYVMSLIGTPTFTLSSVVKPAWMTITVTGNTIVFTGTPTPLVTGATVSFTITNCTSQTATFSDTINVVAPAGNGTFTITNEIPAGINYVKNVLPTPPFYTFASGGIPVAPASTASGYMIAAVTAAVEVYVSCDNPFNYLELYKNGVLVDSIFTATGGIYSFAVTSFAVTDSMEIKYKNV